jgi:hypothetical protein
MEQIVRRTDDKARLEDKEGSDSTNTTQFCDIPSDIMSSHITHYIGTHQYRFIAGINHTLYTLYTTAYPDKETYYNVSSIYHATICFNEFQERLRVRMTTLCKAVARNGKLSVLQHLRFTLHCPWDEDTCSNAT